VSSSGALLLTEVRSRLLPLTTLLCERGRTLEDRVRLEKRDDPDVERAASEAPTEEENEGEEEEEEGEEGGVVTVGEPAVDCADGRTSPSTDARRCMSPGAG
jgi:hypothetical protein